MSDLTAFALDGWRSAGRQKCPHHETIDAWTAWQAGAYARQLGQPEPVACMPTRMEAGDCAVGLDGTVYAVSVTGGARATNRTHQATMERARSARFRSRRHDPADVGLFAPPTLI